MFFSSRGLNTPGEIAMSMIYYEGGRGVKRGKAEFRNFLLVFGTHLPMILRFLSRTTICRGVCVSYYEQGERRKMSVTSECFILAIPATHEKY